MVLPRSVAAPGISRVAQRPLLTVIAYVLDTCSADESDVQDRVASWVG